jgi:hypothetical protein
VLDVILDALLQAPFSIGLLLVGSFLGWTVGSSLGGLVGALSGLAFGMWLDLSDRKYARMLRLPIGVAAVATLLFAFFK